MSERKGVVMKNFAKEWLLPFMIALISVILIKSFLFTILIVEGESMLPTLKDGDRLLVNVFAAKQHDVKYGDIVIVRYTEEDKTKRLVKRVMGVAGDELEVKDGYLYRNNDLVEEDYINETQMEQDMGPITVKEDQYFVMGDNRNYSLDSRIIGAIEEKDIIGIVNK